jgi:ABC-type sugar transport system substrate-binding protein
MKNLLKVLSLVLVLAMVFSFVACAKAEEKAEEKTEEKTEDITEKKSEDYSAEDVTIVDANNIEESTFDGKISIGYTVSSEPEFQTRVRTSLQAVCEEKGYEINIGVYGGDQTKQRSFVESFLNAGADICMDFASNAEIGAALTSLCVDAGKYMIGIDGDYGEGSFYFGTNNPLCATNNGHILGEYVRDNWDGKCDKFVQFTNPEWPPILQSRTDGGWDAFCEILPEYADKKDEVFVNTVYVAGDDLVTQQNVRDWFTQQADDVKSAWIGLSDNSIMVAVSEIEALGKDKQTCCCANDCIGAFLEQLIQRKGETCWFSSLNFNPDGYGPLLIKLCEDIMTDASAVPHMTSFDLPGCNYSNVAEMFPEKYAEVTATMF